MHWHATSTHVRQTHMGSDDLVFMFTAALPCMPACTLTKPQQLTTAHCCSVTVTVKQLSCAQCNSIPEERTAVPAAPALCCAARQLDMPQHAQRDSSLPARLHLLPWVSAASASTPALIYTRSQCSKGTKTRTQTHLVGTWATISWNACNNYYYDYSALKGSAVTMPYSEPYSSSPQLGCSEMNMAKGTVLVIIGYPEHHMLHKQHAWKYGVPKVSSSC